VRPAATVSCEDCGRSWPARTSRFCGRCGQALRPAAADRRRSWSRRASVLAVVSLLAVAVSGLVGVGVRFAGALADRPVASVELPPASTSPLQRGLTGDEAAAALAPFDPDRLRCEPAGCERWRLDVPGGIDGAARLGELLVLQLDQQLVAIDTASGERRWSAPLDAPGGEAPARPGQREPRMMAADDGHLALARSAGDLRVIDRAGRHRWSVPAPAPAWIWEVRLVGDVVVTVGPPPSPADGSTAVHAFDVEDGSPRWTRFVQGLTHHDELFAHLGDDVLARLDPGTGEVVERYTGATALTPLGHGLVLLTDEVAQRSWVVAAGDGDPRATFEGLLETHLDTADHVYALLVPDGRGPDRELVAIAADGTPRWQRTIDLGDSCCPTLALTDDGALYVRRSSGAGQVLDAETGADRPHRDPAPVPAGDWWTGNVAITYGEVGRMTLASATGSVQVLGEDAWLVLDDPVVFASREALLGVDPIPPPVGPRPPTRLPAR
jgi:outer membrane protein assembly factor BamB